MLVNDNGRCLKQILEEQCFKQCLLISAIFRKGFLVEAVPVMLTGIGGPGAPHHFEFQRRESLGVLAVGLLLRFGVWYKRKSKMNRNLGA